MLLQRLQPFIARYEALISELPQRLKVVEDLQSRRGRSSLPNQGG